MFKTFKKYWSYWSAKFSQSFDKNADPEVQLNQAIGEAKEQHKRLREQATTVIANQKKAELDLNAKIEELQKVNAQTRQAVQMTQQAEAQGDTAQVEKLTTTSEILAGKLVDLEADVESQKQIVLQATEAAEKAKEAVDQNSRQLQSQISNKAKLLSKLDQAKMQETVNSAMDSLNTGMNETVPSLKEVEDKINARYTKAIAATELSESSVETQMREIERATTNAAAQDRLAQLRKEMELPSGGDADASS